MSQSRSASLLSRFFAVVVLAVAAWVLLKIVIGVLASIATAVAVILAIAAIVWAIRVL